MEEYSHLACMILVKRPCQWLYALTLIMFYVNSVVTQGRFHVLHVQFPEYVCLYQFYILQGYHAHLVILVDETFEIKTI